MDALALIVFVSFGVACWIMTEKAKTAQAESLAAQRLRQLEAIRWARSQSDLEAAAEQLIEQSTEEENREAQAWNRFKIRWKPDLWDGLRMKAPAGTIHNSSLDRFARRDFIVTFQSCKPEILAKTLALSEERNNRHTCRFGSNDPEP